MTRPHGWLEFAAGSAIGLLVGLIAGLSISPVTSALLGMLSTALLILLGFKEPKEGAQLERHAIRVLGFGLFCAISLIIGVALRTHQALSPSLEKQKARLRQAEVFTDSEIDQILLSTNFGIESQTTAAADPTAASDGKEKKGSKTSGQSTDPHAQGQTRADLASGGFLRAGSTEFCQVDRREQFKDVKAYLAALRRADKRLADVIETAPDSYRDALSKSLSQYICP